MMYPYPKVGDVITLYINWEKVIFEVVAREKDSCEDCAFNYGYHYDCMDYYCGGIQFIKKEGRPE
jgi:hypothetical protein